MRVTPLVFCRLSTGLQLPAGPPLRGRNAGLLQDLGGLSTLPTDTEGDLGQGKGSSQVLAEVARPHPLHGLVECVPLNNKI